MANKNLRVCALGDSFVAGVGDPECRGWLGRIAARSADDSAGVPFVGVFADLARDPVWLREVAAGDGAHPSAGGYTRFADLVATPC